MAINRTSPKKGKVVDIPDAVVTIGTPTAGDSQVSVAFTASSPATGGPVQKYTAISSPGSITASGSTSPVVVNGLTNGTAYTFTVAAANATGNGVFSSASASATPIAPLVGFNSIQTQTVGAGGTASVTFSSIPSTFKNLQIRCIAKGTSANLVDFLGFQFNGDTGSNYSRHLMLADGTNTPQSYGYTSQTKLGAGYTVAANANSNVFGAFVIDIIDYTNTNKYTTIKAIGGADNNQASGLTYVNFSSGAWLNTNVVSSITLFCDSNLAQNSTFALYGIVG